MDVSLAYDGTVALLLVTLRLVAFFVVAPPFNSAFVPMRVRSMMAFAIALPLFGQYIDDVARLQSTSDLLIVVAWQIFAGVTVGMLVAMVFAAVQAAGNLIDVFSSFAMASMLDPMSNTQSAVFGRIYSMIATTLLFATHSHLVLIRGLLGTFTVIPPAEPNMGRVAEMLSHNIDTLFWSALEIAAPILAVLFLTDLALGLVSRAVPSLNIFQLSFPVKTILTVSLAALAVALMPSALEAITSSMMRQMPSLLGRGG